jgi:hypothetical protein
VIEPRTLAEGARLLHIGFRKCGTTALQSALRRARVPLAGFGVVYPGKAGNHTAAALAITGRTHGWVSLGAERPPMQKWEQLASEVAAVGPAQRAIVSSEFFDVADEAAIHSIVDGLGGDQLHVVVTARPLAKILSSAWQQQVKVGLRTSYGNWLQAVLEGTDENRTHKTFWERHDQAAVLSRWAGVVGPDRVTLVVLDDHDRQLPYRSFETMLGVPKGTLEEVPNSANRSMTGAEAELIRQINLEIFATDINWEEYSNWIRRGAAQRMVSKRTPDPDEPRTQTPRWALERATEISADFVRRIERLGINAVGDLQALAELAPGSGVDAADADPTLVPIEAAVEAVLGSGFSTRTSTEPAPPPGARAAAAHRAGELPTGELAKLLAERIQRRLRRAWGRVD